MGEILHGIGIGFGIVLGIAVVLWLMFCTQDLGIWRAKPKEYENP